MSTEALDQLSEAIAATTEALTKYAEAVSEGMKSVGVAADEARHLIDERTKAIKSLESR